MCYSSIKRKRREEKYKSRNWSKLWCVEFRTELYVVEEGLSSAVSQCEMWEMDHQFSASILP